MADHNSIGAERLVNKKAVAEHFGVCPKTVDNWIASGKLTAYRIGNRCVRFKVSEIESALARIGGAE